MKLAAMSLVIFVISCFASTPDQCQAQDLGTKVRQQQALVRQRIEEARGRMDQHRAVRETQTKPYVQTYGDQYATSPGYSYQNRSSGPTSYASPLYARQSFAVQRTVSGYGAQQKYAAQPVPPPGVQSPPTIPQLPPLPASLHTVSKSSANISAQHKQHPPIPSAQSSVSKSAKSASINSKIQAIELDSMQETAEPSVRSLGQIGNAMWLGWWKGGIVGGVYGLIAACVVIIPLQLLRLRGVDPARYNTPAVAAVILMTSTGLSRLNSSKVYDSWAKTIPLLGQLLPASQAPNPQNKDNALKMATFHSAAYCCYVQMPEPVSLTRKLIMNMWTTTLTHQTADGAVIMSYTKMPSPEEMLKQQRAGSPFNAGPDPAPGTVYFDIEKGLDGAAKGSVDQMHGKASSTTRIACGAFSGREVAGSIPAVDGRFKQRLFIGNGNLYQIGTLGKENWVNSKMSQQFLDSFHVK